jgi:hypothetical protein
MTTGTDKRTKSSVGDRSRRSSDMVKCGRGRPVISCSSMRDIEAIDSEVRLLLAIRLVVREEEGQPPGAARVDALLDERSTTTVLNTTVAPA